MHSQPFTKLFLFSLSQGKVSIAMEDFSVLLDLYSLSGFVSNTFELPTSSQQTCRSQLTCKRAHKSLRIKRHGLHIINTNACLLLSGFSHYWHLWELITVDNTVVMRKFTMHEQSKVRADLLPYTRILSAYQSGEVVIIISCLYRDRVLFHRLCFKLRRRQNW